MSTLPDPAHPSSPSSQTDTGRATLNAASRTLCLLTILCAAGPLGCTDLEAEGVVAPTNAELEQYTADLEGQGELRVSIETSMGSIDCQLFEDQTPRTVANFVGLARGLKTWQHPDSKDIMRETKLYDGVLFHRVIPQFMIQTGDPSGDGTGGPGYEFEDEIVSALRFDRPGRLAMANSGPGTNGSQFFITEVNTRHLDGLHTIFGQCSNLDLVREIARVPASGDRPNDPVTIQTMTFRRQSSEP